MIIDDPRRFVIPPAGTRRSSFARSLVRSLAPLANYLYDFRSNTDNRTRQAGIANRREGTARVPDVAIRLPTDNSYVVGFSEFPGRNAPDVIPELREERVLAAAGIVIS
jgi:hypothetical protein